MKKKWGAGKITAAIFGGAAAGMLLLVTFLLGIWSLAKGNPFFGISRAGTFQQYRAEGRTEAEKGSKGPDTEKGSRGSDGEKASGQSGEEDGQGPSEKGSPKEKSGGADEEDAYANSEYYEFHDAIREDLSYQVKFEYYGDMSQDHVSVEMNYPVVSGKATEDFSVVNRAVQRELEEVKEYASTISEWLPRESSYSFDVESYVTYMDEEVLSIIYVEYGYLDDGVYESYVVCVNIDMESGMALTNSQMLDIDDAFSVDFRRRCEKQNGEISSLSMFSDQDITDMLNDDESLIIFYTPLGMEVGFNYYYGWVTVTYRDYQKYQSHF